MARAFWIDTISQAIMFDVVYAISLCLYGPVLDTLLYDLTDAAKNIWQFEIMVEAAYDIGATCFWIIGFLVTYYQFDVRLVLLAGLIGIVPAVNGFYSFYCEREVSFDAGVKAVWKS